MLRGAYVAQVAKAADEVKPRLVEKNEHPVTGGVRQAKQAWQPALREGRHCEILPFA
jgi:hypothetical protein